jgi:predicted peptidase
MRVARQFAALTAKTKLSAMAVKSLFLAAALTALAGASAHGGHLRRHGQQSMWLTHGHQGEATPFVDTRSDRAILRAFNRMG